MPAMTKSKGKRQKGKRE